jgi:polysaccharide biosynthesis protein PslH
MLVQTLPFPPDSGVAIRTYNVMRLLARDYDVTALCFYRVKHGQASRDLDACVRGLGKIARVRAFAIPQEHSRARLLWDHGRSVLTRKVYTDYAYESAEFAAAVRAEVASGDYALAHVDSLDLAPYFRLLGDLPVVCVHHNIESALLRRRAGVAKSALLRRYLAFQADLMERAEREWCPRVRLNVVVSPDDAKGIAALAPTARVELVPNGVDIDTYQPGTVTDPRGVVFVGGTTWFPNRDALEFFAQDVLPILRTRVPDVHITWAGRSSEEERIAYREKYGIELTGYLDDIRPTVAAAACYIVPLRVGGGTRLKILDAWSMGKAIVSTSVGCEGLVTADGENILIRDDPATFAEAIAQVLLDPALRERLGRAGRIGVEERYSWDVIGRSMARAYHDVTARRG